MNLEISGQWMHKDVYKIFIYSSVMLAALATNNLYYKLKQAQ